jgi:hypothetical protein
MDGNVVEQQRRAKDEYERQRHERHKRDWPECAAPLCGYGRRMGIVDGESGCGSRWQGGKGIGVGLALWVWRLCRLQPGVPYIVKFDVARTVDGRAAPWTCSLRQSGRIERSTTITAVAHPRHLYPMRSP